jgi:hypothetical protein
VNGVILTSPEHETIEKELESLLLSDKLCDIAGAAYETIKKEFSLEVAAENFRSVREKHNS